MSVIKVNDKKAKLGWSSFGVGRKCAAEPTVTVRVPVSRKAVVVKLVQQMKVSPSVRFPSWLACQPLAELSVS